MDTKEAAVLDAEKANGLDNEVPAKRSITGVKVG